MEWFVKQPRLDDAREEFDERNSFLQLLLGLVSISRTVERAVLTGESDAREPDTSDRPGRDDWAEELPEDLLR